MFEREQRKHARVPVEIGAQIRNESGWFLCRVLNISVGGLFLKVPTLFPHGNILKVKFQLPDPGGPMEVQGRVVWSTRIGDANHPVFGVGVEFCDLVPAYRDTLFRFVSGALKNRPTELQTLRI